MNLRFVGMDPPTFISPAEENSINSSDNASSPASNAESQPPKRKRLTQACDACRKKKVKCSGEKPSCNNCTRLGTHCTYLPSTRKRGPRVGLVESLEKRLQQMEKLLQPLKEQGLVDDSVDNSTGRSTKKQRPNPKVNNVSDTPFSNIGANPVSSTSGDSSYFAGSAFIAPNFQNNDKFYKTPGAFNKPNQQSQSPYGHNVPYHLLSPLQKTYPLRTSSEEMSRFMEQQTNNDDDSQEDKHKNYISRNAEKEEDELLFFGKTSIRPGFVHPSDLPFICIVSPSSSTSSILPGSASSGETPPSIHSPMPNIIMSIGLEDFPRVEIVEHLASCYFRNFDSMVPIFHEPTFMKLLRQNKVSSILVFAMCALGAKFSNHPSIVGDTPRVSSEKFAMIANSMIFRSFDFPSVEFVQALVLLTLHMYSTCKGPRSWIYIGMAIRMAQEIGLHKVDETPVGAQYTKDKSEAAFIQKEIRRRTFWSCFLLDRSSACAVGRPTLIDEDDCDVRFPCNEAIWNYDHPYSKVLIEEYYNKAHVKQESRMTLTNNGLFACLVCVKALLGRVSQFVNRSRPSNSLHLWEPHSQFAILSNEINLWYNSLSPHYTYTKERLQKLMTNGTGAMFATIHLIYYSVIIILNRPNTAPLPNYEGIEESHREFIRKSAERCSVAAKAVSSISADILAHGVPYLCVFTLYPLYVTSTVLVNDICSSNSSIAEEAKKNLEIIKEYLLAADPYWAMAGKLLRMIAEMRKDLEEKLNIVNNSTEQRNSEQLRNEMYMGTDAGFLSFWNRTSAVDTNDISSIMLPERLLSSHWFDDLSINDTWSNLLRSSDPFSPRAISRFIKKDKNSNGESSTDDNYFNQEMANYNYPPPMFNGYPMMDPTTANQNAYELNMGKYSSINRPLKHWRTVNGNNITSVTEKSTISDTQSQSSASIATGSNTS